MSVAYDRTERREAINTAALRLTNTKYTNKCQRLLCVMKCSESVENGYANAIDV